MKIFWPKPANRSIMLLAPPCRPLHASPYFRVFREAFLEGDDPIVHVHGSQKILATSTNTWEYSPLRKN